MKELHGTADAEVSRPIAECFALLAAIEAYPDWYPEVVRSVELLEHGPGGRPTRAQTVLHVAHGPLIKDFDLLLAIRVAPSSTVHLTRIPHGACDDERFEVIWHLERRAVGTHMSVELLAELAVPRLVPLGGIGNAIAGGFLRAAAGALESARR